MTQRNYLNGTIKRHPDGFGFFIPEDPAHPDVYIPRNSMQGVMTNDKVMIQVFPERGGDRFRGEVVRILEHGTKQVVGRFFKLNSTTGILRDEGKGWGEDLKIKIEDSMNAKEKELVAAEILTYPGEKSFTGRVVQIIGDALDPLNDIRRVLAVNNIPVAFSPETLEEAKRFKEQPEEKDFRGRQDLRNLDLITIDGATAKDFDDAVYVESNDKGFRLYVAIADVSHYVRVGSAIDKDAYERGTSVYFPNYVVPMLPEVLSNGLCSLNPHVPRLCVVAEMQFDFTGEMQSSRFYEAVMESKARVTYGEAQEIIDGNPVEKLNHVRDGILRLADLAKILMAKRFRDGSLDLEIPETQLVIDASGIPIDISKSERLFSHRLIEEMMLAANVGVAKFLSGKNIPALYRIHEPPNEQAIHLLEKYLQTFGGNIQLSAGKLQKRLTKALEEFAGKPQSQVLNILTLRSMSQAKYNQENVGHFGLGFDFYTHFTSPIRRYPDLIVHRLLKSQIMTNSPYRLMSEEDLATAGTVLSAAEQRSVKAERQVQAIKKARFMEKFVGRELDGMISSVAKFGVFVLLREYDIDGLIRLDDLSPQDKLEFDEENLTLTAKRSGFSYNIGDPIRIQVAAVDIEAGQINFIPAENTDTTTVAQKTSTRFLDRLRGKGKKENRQDNKDNKQDRRDRSKQASRDAGSQQQRTSSRAADPKSKDRFSRGSDRRQEERRGGERRQNERRQDERRGRRDEPSFAKKHGGKPARSFEKARPSGETPTRRQAEEPNENLLKMILGPDEFKRRMNEKENKPQLSRKLMFAENSKNRFNKDIIQTENESVTSEDRNANRKNSKKRRSSENDRGSVRKARVSQRRGKGKAR
jgi:ribonuclease R